MKTCSTRTRQTGQVVCLRPQARHKHWWPHGTSAHRGVSSSKQIAHSFRAAGWAFVRSASGGGRAAAAGATSALISPLEQLCLEECGIPARFVCSFLYSARARRGRRACLHQAAICSSLRAIAIECGLPARLLFVQLNAPLQNPAPLARAHQPSNSTMKKPFWR